MHKFGLWHFTPLVMKGIDNKWNDEYEYKASDQQAYINLVAVCAGDTTGWKERNEKSKQRGNKTNAGQANLNARPARNMITPLLFFMLNDKYNICDK